MAIILGLGVFFLAAIGKWDLIPFLSNASVGVSSPNPGLPTPSVDIPSGFYTVPQKITLSVPDGAIVHYTTSPTGGH